MSGTLRWSRGAEQTGSASYQVDLGAPDDRKLILRFALNGEPREYTIRMEAKPMRYGGFRYYLICPRSGRRCEVLALVGGQPACRQYHRLVYASQSDDVFGRYHRTIDRLEKRLAKRPRGENRRRLRERLSETTWALDDHFAAEAMRRFGMLW